MLDRKLGALDYMSIHSDNDDIHVEKRDLKKFIKHCNETIKSSNLSIDRSMKQSKKLAIQAASIQKEIDLITKNLKGEL